MGSVVLMVSPAGDQSRISVSRSDAGVDLVFERPPGLPRVSLLIAVAQARLLADALRKEAM